ncbi:MAG: discoidin domain-containing protein [Myxococcales bacterium]
MLDQDRKSIQTSSLGALSEGSSAPNMPLATRESPELSATSTAGGGATTLSATTAKRPVWSALQAVRQYLLMTDKLAAAREQSLCKGQPGFAEFELARSLLDTARSVDDLPQRAWGAIQLLLQASNFAVRALVLRRGLVEDAPSSSALWTLGRKQPEIEGVFSALPERVRIRVDELLARGSLEVDHSALSASELIALRSTLTSVAAKLVELLEREVTLRWRIKSERAFRWTALGMVVLAVACWNYRADIRSMMLPNLALHKEARVSSNWRPGIYPPAGLVDGETTELGCHTDIENYPWAQIDLGQTRTIHRVVVTNRVDGDTMRAVPLMIELSSDGKSFAPYARQESDFKVWTAKGRLTKARFVRVTVQKQSMLHLNEIEVY